MRVLLQRVNKACVSINGKVIGRIGKGLVLLVGVAGDDTDKDINYLVEKVAGLRIFADDAGKFNLSIQDVKGELLIISQFTLLADTRKGRRPSFTEAAPPDQAESLFNEFVKRMHSTGLNTETGEFQQYMQVEIHNDGPVTIMLDSRDKF
jgi:D-tyrosyl-tRNA(Tyr) deacylase